MSWMGLLLTAGTKKARLVPRFNPAPLVLIRNGFIFWFVS